MYSCSNTDKNNGCEECVYTVSSNETTGNVPAEIQGVHNLTLDFSQNGYTFSNGTKATFTISANEMIVNIEGGTCITLKNPTVSSNQVEYTFKDNCRDNVSYAASISSNGGLNEINVITLNGSFYGQFN